MRMPRLVTRRWLALVAVLGLAVAPVAWLDRRSRHFADRDHYHLGRWLAYVDHRGDEAALHAAEHHRRMSDMYHQAATATGAVGPARAGVMDRGNRRSGQKPGKSR